MDLPLFSFLYSFWAYGDRLLVSEYLLPIAVRSINARGAIEGLLFRFFFWDRRKEEEGTPLSSTFLVSPFCSVSAAVGRREEQLHSFLKTTKI